VGVPFRLFELKQGVIHTGLAIRVQLFLMILTKYHNTGLKSKIQGKQKELKMRLLWKKAGIVLILEKIKDRKYWIRLNTTIDHFNLPIDIWTVGEAAY